MLKLNHMHSKDSGKVGGASEEQFTSIYTEDTVSSVSPDNTCKSQPFHRRTSPPQGSMYPFSKKQGNEEINFWYPFSLIIPLTFLLCN